MPDQSSTIDEGLIWADQAHAIDDRLEIGHGVLAVLLAMSGHAEEAAVSAATATAINPNNAFCLHASALPELFKEPPDTIKMVSGGEGALRLSPKDPSAHAFQNLVTLGHLIAQLDHAGPAFQESARAVARCSGAPWYVHLLAATAEIVADDFVAARRHLATALKLRPDVSFAKYRHSFPFPAQQRLFEIGDRNGANERMIELGLPRQ